jgi:pantoate--beta-alanine ligase
MGALHAGHMALVDEARRHARHVVASIFVNPTQFGPNEDLSRYPRREAGDAKMLEEAGCDILWAPDAATMYPEGPAATVRAGPASRGLDGDSRPSHFDGVATVVARLFEQVEPDVALSARRTISSSLSSGRWSRSMICRCGSSASPPSATPTASPSLRATSI